MSEEEITMLRVTVALSQHLPVLFVHHDRVDAAGCACGQDPLDHTEHVARAIVDALSTPTGVGETPSPSSSGLGLRITGLLDEHWPNSGVNGHYLADLLRTTAQAAPTGAGGETPC